MICLFDSIFNAFEKHFTGPDDMDVLDLREYVMGLIENTRTPAPAVQEVEELLERYKSSWWLLGYEAASHEDYEISEENWAKMNTLKSRLLAALTNTTPNLSGDLRERIADIQHQIWAHWMKYLFSVINDDRSIPPEKAEHWLRQIETSYPDLPKHEKESDREQADKVLAALTSGDGPVEKWISVRDRLPEPGRRVITHFINCHGKSRRIMAFHAPRFTLDEDYCDETLEGSEYCKENDTYYLREGWYENNEFEDTNWSVAGDITHWMPLPEPPRKAGE